MLSRSLPALWSWLLLAPLGSAALAQQLAGALPVHVTIHADQPGATIDRHLYGQFAEHLGRGIYEGV